MPDIKVTQLPELTTPSDTDILPIIASPSSGATTKKITKANLVASTVATITAHTARTDNPHTVTKAQVGLGSVDNTADASKPLSTAATTALTGKEPSITAGTTAQYYRGDKTFQTLDKAAVGLPLVVNVDATARANHTGTQSADTLIDGTTNKAFLATERTKLTGITTGATANATDAQLRDRSTHTGTQTASTISDFQTTVSANTTVTANTTHAARTDNPHAVTKAQVGLNLVPNLDPTQQKQQAVIQTTPSYVLDTFTLHPERWVHSSGGTSAIKDGVLTLTTPANNDTIAVRTLWTAILQDFDTITFDVNFNGNTFLTASDTPLMSFDQAGDKGIVLTNFATNGATGWQTISLPLSRFTSNFDATSSTNGTGTALAPNTTVSNLKLRVYESTAGKTLSFRNIVISDSTNTLRQDFTQPTLFAAPKPGSSTWRVQSLDIMKVTKDNVQGQSTDAYMANIMAAVKPFNPTHIAVAIPYDDPATYPGTAPQAGYALRWASAIRTAGRNVFWRQMPLEWEGIYSKAKNTTRQPGTATGVLNGTETTTYLKQIYDYIVAHPDQYRPGDIIAPIPEPENGGINGVVNGPTGGQFADVNQFRRWLRDAITVTNAALDVIGLRGQIAVGFFGTSGFIVFGNTGNPKGFLDERTLDAMGVLGMDDYPNPASDMATDLTKYEALYGQFPLMLTEWGTINETTDAARLAAMQTVLDTLKSKPYFYGLNYWTIIGGAGNANEDILDWSTFAPIGGYANLLKTYTGGIPLSPATHLVTNTGALIQLNAASGGSVGDTLTLLTTGSAAFRTPATPTASITTATNKGAVYATGATTATSTAALTDGQLLIGSSAGNPAPATITAGTGITVTNAANAITIAASGGSTAARYHVAVPFENLAAYQSLLGGSATAANNSGYIQLQTGGTADSYVILGKNYGGTAMPSTTMQHITGYARLVFNTGNGEINYRFFTDNSNLSVSTAKQVGFRTAGGNLYASSGNGTTEQATLLTAPAFNTFAAYSAECLDGTSVKFYVDGVLVATHTTSVPPAASGATGRLNVPGIKITNYAGNNYMALWVADAGYSYQPY